MYRKLVEFHKEGKLSFQYIKTFNMDEYVGTEKNETRKTNTHSFPLLPWCRYPG